MKPEPRLPRPVWLGLIVLACLLPFIGKPFHIDDPLFLKAAQHLQSHPLDFQGAQINWYGQTERMTENFNNPPLTSYYLALAASVFGWGEIALHLAFLLPALVAAIGIYRLAELYTLRPFTAALAALLTPVFLVSATNVMCDVLLLAFWVWAVVCFERGLRQKSARWFIAAGVIAGLAFWTKYTGLALVPLLAAYGFTRERKPGVWLVAVGISLAMVLAHECLTFMLYGRGLLLTASSVAAKARPALRYGVGEQLVTGLGFVGACFLPLLLYAPWLWSRRALAMGAALLCLLILVYPRFASYALLWDAAGQPNWNLCIQSVVFMAAGVVLLLLVAGDAWERRSADSLLLVLWVGGIFVFATVVNWTLNARSLLPMAPAVGLLLARRAERTIADNSRRAKFFPALPAVAAACFCFLPMKADYENAAMGKRAAAELSSAAAPTGKATWFQGHWGFQYYMEQRGARALERDCAGPIPGDAVVVPADAVNGFELSTNFVRIIRNLQWDQFPWCVTVGSSAGAGFYAATGGPFPFSLGTFSPESYYVFRVLRPAAEIPEAVVGPFETGAVKEQFAFERRAAALGRAVQAHPEDLDARLELAETELARARFTQARQQLEAVLKLQPAHAPAESLLKKIPAEASDETTGVRNAEKP